ncbi:MAG: primosomal protein N'' [Alteromonadaceae bacterium]|jgi:primosomal protein N''
MKNVLPHLDNSIQDIYRKAVDADQQIIALKKQGMAKFSSIFPKQSLFVTTGNAFMPYVSELSEDIEQFKHNQADENQLALILKKMEQLLKVLSALKNITKK